MTPRFCLVFCLLIGYGLGQPSYDPQYIEGSSRLNYNVSGDAKRFPAEENVTESTYNYFISKLNFDAIDGKIVTGAADKLYLLGFDLQEEDTLDWPTDSNIYGVGMSTQCATLSIAASNRYACRNHIRVFETLPDDDQKLFVCGTQSTRQPRCRTVDISGDMFSAGDPSPATDGIISLHPDLPGFGEFRNVSNESDTTFFSAGFFQRTDARQYSISYQDVTLMNTSNLDSLEMTERFRTISANNNWLRFPVTFVDYYKADYPVVLPATMPEHYQFYFVFLRENLFDGNSADIIYSRIVRICRNDMGSMMSMGGSRYFTTYLKARIFCEREVPSESNTRYVGAIDYQYNVMRSMAFNGGGGRTSENGNWNKMMYGAFTGPLIGPIGSAICVYNAENTLNATRGTGGFGKGIFDIFRGDLQVEGQNGMVSEEQNTFVECEPGGREDDDAQRVLIVGNVKQTGEDPILAFDGYYISQMVVDRVCVVRSEDMDECVNQDVLFLGTSTGRIMKVVFATNVTQSRITMRSWITPVVSEEITLDDGNIINNLQIQAMGLNKYLFANTLSRIYRLPLHRCSRLNNCSRCIESRDPYCVWNTASNMCELNDLEAAESGGGAVPPNIRQDVHSGNSTLLCSPPVAESAEVGFDSSRTSVSESAGVVMLTIRTSNAETTGTLTLRVLGGNATSGTDYMLQQSMNIRIPTGQQEVAVSISIEDDNVYEGTESFTIALSSTGDVVFTRENTTVIIIDNDGALFQIGLSGPKCNDWINSSVEAKTEGVVDEIVSVVNSNCACGLTRQQFQNPGFRCGTNDNLIVFRSELLSTQQSSPSELRMYIETWATFAPEILVENVYLKVDSMCPVAIESLRDQACGEGSQPTTAGVMPVCDTGSATAGWVIAALAVVAVIILSIAVVLLGFLYCRARNKQEYTVTPGAIVPLMRLESDHSNVSTLVTENTKGTVNTYENTSNTKDTEKERKLNEERACHNAHSSPEGNSVVNTTYENIEEVRNVEGTEEERRLSKPRFSWHNPRSSPGDNSGGAGGGEKADMV